MRERLPEGTLTRRYAGSAASTLLLRVVSALVGLWSTRQLVDALGDASFGLVALAWSALGLAAFAGLGLPAGITRAVADLRGRGEVEQVRPLLRATSRWFAGVGLAVGAALALFALAGGVGVLAIPGDLVATATGVLLVAGAGSVLTWPLGAYPAALAGMQRYGVLGITGGVTAIAAALAGVGVARAGGGPAGVLAAALGTGIVGGAAQAWIVERSLRRSATAPPPSRASLRELLRFGAGVLALELAAVLIYGTDQILLGVVVSLESVAAYAVASRLHTLVREAHGAMVAALFPILAEERGRGNPAAAEQAIYRGTRYAAGLVVPGALACVLLSGAFVESWMGPSFAWVGPISAAFVGYWLVAPFTGVLAQVALGSGEAGLLGRIALAAAVVNVVVSLALVRRWGVGGVVAGTLVAYALAIPAQVVLLFPRLGVDRRRFLREAVLPVAACVVPAAILATVLLASTRPSHTWATVIGWGVAIVVLCWVPLWFVAVEPRDRRRLAAWVLRTADGRS